MDFLFDFVPSFFRCGFSAFGMGDWSLLVFFFSSRRLCRSCLAKIAFNRLCQLVSERSVGHPTTSFFLFFFLSFPRDRAARRNLSWCLFFSLSFWFRFSRRPSNLYAKFSGVWTMRSSKSNLILLEWFFIYDSILLDCMQIFYIFFITKYYWVEPILSYSNLKFKFKGYYRDIYVNRV